MKKVLLTLLLATSLIIVVFSQPHYYSTISNYVNNNIKANGTNSITGAKMNTALTYIFESLGLRGYDSTATYTSGKSGVIYGNKLYICTTTISSPESWTLGHWTQTFDFTDTLNLSARIDSLAALDSTWIKATVDTLVINGYNQTNAIITSSVTITHDSLLVLKDRPQLLLASPGSGKIIVILETFAYNDFLTDTLENNDSLFLVRYQTATNFIGSFDSNWVKSTSDSYVSMAFINNNNNMLPNKGIYLETEASINPTSGGGDMKFYITYYIKEL